LVETQSTASLLQQEDSQLQNPQPNPGPFNYLDYPTILSIDPLVPFLTGQKGGSGAIPNPHFQLRIRDTAIGSHSVDRDIPHSL
jgi:hypothetical protein